jgi:hypothetical protein
LLRCAENYARDQAMITAHEFFPRSHVRTDTRADKCLRT